MKLIKKFVLVVLSLISIVNFNGCGYTHIDYGVAYYAPCWSADGTKIYYFRNDVAERHIVRGPVIENYAYNQSEWFVCSCNPDGSNQQVIAKMPDFSRGSLSGLEMVWGYYSNKVWLSVFENSDSICVSMNIGSVQGIWILDFKGSLKRISNTGQHASIMPMNNTIIYDEETQGIWMINIDGTEKRQILTEGWYPIPSPVNPKFAFEHYEGLYSQYLAVSDTCGDSIKILIEDAIPGSWSLDGTEIFCKYIGIEKIKVDTDSQKTLTDVKGGIPRISPDGNKIVFADDFDMGNIWVLDINTKTLQKILKGVEKNN